MNGKLPADPVSMTLAIIAVCLMVICCCFGGTYVALVLSIIGFILAVNSIKKYNEAPHNYSADSYRKVNNAKTFNLVLMIISGVLVVLGILSLVADFAFLDQDLFEKIMEEQGINIEEEYGDDNGDYDEGETYEATEDDWQYTEEVEVDTTETVTPVDSENYVELHCIS